MSNFTRRFYSNDFDSYIEQDLRTGDYVLTLLLRVFLRQENPPPGQNQFQAVDSDHNTAPAIRWSNDEWEQFKKEFKRQAYAAWNDAFVLIPPSKFNGFVDSEGVRRNVKCALEIQLKDSGGPNTHYVDIVRLAKPEDHLTPYADYRPSKGEPHRPGQFTSNDTTPVKRTGPYLDAVKTRLVNGKLRYYGGSAGNNAERLYTWEQHAFPHEVGHMLGLNHINEDAPACQRSPNSARCYGVLGSDSINIMGRGDHLDARNAEPWLKRIVKHTPPTHQIDWRADLLSRALLRGIWGSFRSA